ncbi:DegT/DnrJ/EryC1/StrS family aminotransferase, partial [Candidatus Pelagibacter bacterium]|nr:DegT/DnrJ/EryC1/StrS family aminotransferase [Candidatus Pelagibacter bacterium]
MKSNMKLSVPHIDKSDIRSINSALKSGWISTSSKKIKMFEDKIARFCNTKYSVALNSGTSAIHLGLKILGVDNTTEVIVPSLTFIATVNPILYLGAQPIIFDVDNYHNLKIKDVINFIQNETKFKNNKTINKKTKKVIKAVIVAHMWGRACDFSKLKDICAKRNIFILEDAAEALGSYIKKSKNKHCGSAGDIGCLSFNANKIITTGSGGAIITNNKKFYEKAQYLANQAKDDTFNYIHNECGYNYKMNSICAALGISQLNRIKKKINKREKIYKRYLFNFKNFKNIKILSHDIKSNTNYWMNIMNFKLLNFKQTHDLSLCLSKKKIETRRIWRPLNLQLHLKKFQKYNILNASKLYENSLCVPSDDN